MHTSAACIEIVIKIWKKKISPTSLLQIPLLKHSAVYVFVTLTLFRTKYEQNRPKIGIDYAHNYNRIK